MLFREKIKQCSNLLQHFIVDRRYIENGQVTENDKDARKESLAGLNDFDKLKLKDIAEQRSMYSSIDDIVYAQDSDSDFDEPVDLINPRQKYSLRSNSPIEQYIEKRYDRCMTSEVFLS